MPILVSTLDSRIRQTLDAEGSDRYTFDQDIKIAINKSIETMVSMFNKAFADNKLSPEALRELTKIKIWQLNAYSRFAFKKSDTGHDLWSVLAIYPEPELNKSAGAVSVTNAWESKFRDDVSFVRSKQSAKRLNLEEWNENTNNAFTPGNNLLKGALLEYAYLDPIDYSSKSYNAGIGQYEFQVRPDIPKKLVALAYVKYPEQVNLITDTIEFPENLTEMITEIALAYISHKQGDATSLYQITAQGINSLVNLMR